MKFLILNHSCCRGFETLLQFMKLLNSVKLPLKRLRIHNIFTLYVGLGSAGFGEGPVEGTCEYGTELLRTIKYKEISYPAECLSASQEYTVFARSQNFLPCRQICVSQIFNILYLNNAKDILHEETLCTMKIIFLSGVLFLRLFKYASTVST